jgi:hypothetical protein
VPCCCPPCCCLLSGVCVAITWLGCGPTHAVLAQPLLKGVARHSPVWPRPALVMCLIMESACVTRWSCSQALVGRQFGTLKDHVQPGCMVLSGLVDVCRPSAAPVALSCSQGTAVEAGRKLTAPSVYMRGPDSTGQQQQQQQQQHQKQAAVLTSSLSFSDCLVLLAGR